MSNVINKKCCLPKYFPPTLCRWFRNLMKINILSQNIPATRQRNFCRGGIWGIAIFKKTWCFSAISIYTDTRSVGDLHLFERPLIILFNLNYQLLTSFLHQSEESTAHIFFARQIQFFIQAAHIFIF